MCQNLRTYLLQLPGEGYTAALQIACLHFQSFHLRLQLLSLSYSCLQHSYRSAVSSKDPPEQDTKTLRALPGGCPHCVRIVTENLAIYKHSQSVGTGSLTCTMDAPGAAAAWGADADSWDACCPRHAANSSSSSRPLLWLL